MEKQEKCMHFAGGACKILRVTACREGCSFYREEHQAASSRVEWQKRMNGLDAERQRKIAGLYFGGKMPWKEQLK
ncbi:MAG: hypothetical protein IJP27_01345 [Clostridia bacterium]|nr:hypothetical protein [Clostridia bacterium]